MTDFPCGDLTALRVLVLVAHPDDEAIGAGVLLQRLSSAQVVYCTSGAPSSPHIWFTFGGPFRCARIRRSEAERAVGLTGHRAVFLGLPDGKLFLRLRKAFGLIQTVVAESKPNLIVTHAYESGHQDHDACSFLAAMIARRFAIPVWEMPYYRSDLESGRLVYQAFIDDRADTRRLTATTTELQVKRRMFDAHSSQRRVLDEFDPACELFRPQPRYDYSKPVDARAAKIAVSGVSVEKLCSSFRSFAEAYR